MITKSPMASNAHGEKIHNTLMSHHIDPKIEYHGGSLVVLGYIAYRCVGYIYKIDEGPDEKLTG